MNICIIGRGGVAQSFYKALKDANHNVKMVEGRAIYIPDDSDIYIISVYDKAISEVIQRFSHVLCSRIALHTAGSISLDVFKDKCIRYGVIYPLQTFSKDKLVAIQTVPLLIEGSDEEVERVIESLALTISGDVRFVSSKERKAVHLSAVFACNFVNACYAMAEDILSKEGMDFDILLPLIDETASKVHALSPVKAQTGPAKRDDVEVMNDHLKMLSSDTELQNIYKLLSKRIHDKL